MHGKGCEDTPNGFANTSDWEEGLHGEGGNDKLSGGAGWDILVGGPGNATMRGDEPGEQYVDSYKFASNSWGHDAIEDTPSKLRGTGPFFDSNVLYITGDVSANVYVNLTSSGARHEATTGTSTVNWQDSVIDDVQNQGIGYDTVVGNPVAAALNPRPWAGTPVGSGPRARTSHNGNSRKLVFGHWVGR